MGKRIDLAWMNPTGTVGYPYVYIKVERRVAGGSYSELAQVGGEAVSYIDSSCINGTSYYYRVRGRARNGMYSAYSNEAGVIPSCKCSYWLTEPKRPDIWRWLKCLFGDKKRCK
jgi:hypothetical protein